MILDSPANWGALDTLAATLAEETKPIALIGAGMSLKAGLPTWSKLLEDLKQELPKKVGSDMRKLLEAEENLPWRAQEYKSMLQANVYASFISQKFGKCLVRHDDPTVALVKLPFRHFITTNYDDVIARAHLKADLEVPNKLTWNEIDARSFIFSLRKASARRSVLHLHGHHSEIDSIVLTDEDYVTRYVKKSDTFAKLFAIFSTEHIVFMGFSLSDPDLMALLRQVNAMLGCEEEPHFAILGIKKDDVEKESINRRKFIKKFGIQPIFYEVDDDHSGLMECLRFLEEEWPKYKKTENAAEVLKKRVAALDPEDPQKGQWGGRSESNGRKLSAVVKPLAKDWFEVTITVESLPGESQLAGDVFFHLHPTLPPKVRTESARNGKAQLVVESYGAYTVGVQTDEGKTQLELDLSKLKGIPNMFRLN